MGKNKQQDLQVLIGMAVSSALSAYTDIMEEKMQGMVEEAMKHGADIGAKAAARAVERERKKIQKKQYYWKYHNTKLLIRNYRLLNDYFQNAVFDLTGAKGFDLSFEEIMRMMQDRTETEEIFVESIKRNYMHTKIIMTHVNKMLDVYRIMCERSRQEDDARHWRVLYRLYISEDIATVEEIAAEEHINRRTVYKDVDICISDLTALMFGVSGIERLD